MKKTLAFLLLTSLLLRLWFALGYWAGKPLTYDANEYLELARNYNEQGKFVYDPRHTGQIEHYGRAPGYPFWLALLLRVAPTIGWVRLAEVLISLFTSYMFFVLSREIFSLRTALIALILSSFYLPFFFLIPSILSENVWLALMLVSYFFLLRGAKLAEERRRIYFVGAFSFLAIATLVRPAAVFVLPLYILWIYRHSNWKNAAVLPVFYFLILLPWNWQLFHESRRVIFVASEGGVTFWTGTHPAYSGDGDLASNPAVQYSYRHLLKEHAHQSSSQRERIYIYEAFRNIREHPGAYLWNEVKKLAFWFFPFGMSVQTTSGLHRVTSLVFYLPLLALAVSGYRRLPPDLRFFFGGVVLSFTIMILIFFPQERFRIATLDPMFLLIASNELTHRLGSRLSRILQ